MTNALVGDDHVNTISLMKRATRLSPETQVTLGGYYGGHPPPKKWTHFRAKTKQLTRAKFVFYFSLERRFEQGVGSLAEGARARDSLRLREDTALLSRLQPGKTPTKIELP
jgi:hypothetical protein